MQIPVTTAGENNEAGEGARVICISEYKRLRQEKNNKTNANGRLVNLEHKKPRQSFVLLLKQVKTWLYKTGNKFFSLHKSLN